MKKITIVWGTDKEDKKTYEFKTDEQLKYFMMGVDEANGWLEYEIEENSTQRFNALLFAAALRAAAGLSGQL